MSGVTKDTLDKEILLPFNGHIVYLTKLLEKKNDYNPSIKELQNRVHLATTTDPFILIQEAGPYVFKYRDQIRRNDIEFFMASKPDDLIDGDVPEEIDAGNIIELCKQNWNNLKDSEKSIIIDKVKSLLTLYVRFLLYEQERKKNKSK